MTSIENVTSTIVCVGCDTVLLFESLRGVPDNERMKGCELKDSFMSGEEAALVMLIVSHLPALNLSKVYIFFDALAEYVREKDGRTRTARPPSASRAWSSPS